MGPPDGAKGRTALSATAHRYRFYCRLVRVCGRKPPGCFFKIPDRKIGMIDPTRSSRTQERPSKLRNLIECDCKLPAANHFDPLGNDG